MLTLTGDILNWFAAGVLLPCLFLPLAALISERRSQSTLLWLAIVIIVVGAGALFAALAPILRITPSPNQALVFGALILFIGAIVFALGGAHAFSEKLTPPLQAITQNIGKAVMWLLLLMAFTQFAVVILRYVFGLNYIFMQESITYMHGAVFLLAAGYALLSNDHVRVDIFYRDAPPRRKALIDFVGAYFFLFPVCLVLLWSASPYVAQSWAAREGSAETSGIQAIFILKSLIPSFAVLLAMAGFVVAARAGARLKGRG